jgi:choline-glycine betaine transporter
MSMVAASVDAVSLVARVVAETEAHHTELPMPSFMFGLVAAAIFAILGFVMFSYRDVANRQPHSSDAAARPGGSAPHGHDATATGH